MSTFRPGAKIPSRIHIVHDELGYIRYETKDEVAELMSRLPYYDPADEEAVELRVVKEGRYLDFDTGDPKSARVANQMRALLLGTDNHIRPNMGRNSTPPPMALIVDWITQGSVVQLSGSAKSGKTDVVVDIIRTIVDPSWRFLGQWARGPIDPEELERGVVLVNTEMPGEAMERLLDPLREVPIVKTDGTIVSARDLVVCYNLRDMAGGAAAFNLLDSEVFEQWIRILMTCVECEGDDNVSPFLVIFDNLTAVLRDLRLNVQEHNGELAEAFRKLLTEAEVPNGIVVAHGTKAAGTALGGSTSAAVSDGEIVYSASGRGKARFISNEPRSGFGLREVSGLRVRQDDTGRLIVGKQAVAVIANAGEDDVTIDLSDFADPEESTAPKLDGDGDTLRSRLEAAGSTGMRKTPLTGGGAVGARLRVRLETLVKDGEVVVKQEGVGLQKGERYWLTDQAPTG